VKALPFAPRGVRVADLPAALATVTDLSTVRALASADTRATVGPLYEARLQELEPRSLDGASREEVSRRGYRMGMWGHHPNYECLDCGFATLQWHLMRAHVRRVHGRR
jgi:hypothetical protein